MTTLLLYTAAVLVIALIEIRRQRAVINKVQSLVGLHVYNALTDKAKLRTSPDNVSDVLDAIDAVAMHERVWQ